MVIVFARASSHICGNEKLLGLFDLTMVSAPSRPFEL
jgi:hypothetical protein